MNLIDELSMLCNIMLCYAMLWYDMLCNYDMLRYVTSRHVTARHVTSRHVTLYQRLVLAEGRELDACVQELRHAGRAEAVEV